MNNIINISDYKPHASGECKCMACGHEWSSTIPLPIKCDLECPKCRLPRGTTKYPLGLSEGSLIFRCNCGCENFAVAIGKIMCISCGTTTNLEDLD